MNNTSTNSLLNSLAIVLAIFTLTAHSAVLIKDKQWAQNQTLNVLFLDGDLITQQLVKKIASQWLTNTNLKFNFYHDAKTAPKQTHIRISFLSHTGSQLGNHQDYLSQSPTMGLFDLSSNDISDNGSIRIILHEFGHALGLEHEYRSPYWPYGIQSIKQYIQDCLPKMQLIGYSPAGAKAHCQTINASIKIKKALLTAYDELSIMNYPSSFIFDNTQYQIKPAVKLSVLDRHAIQQWYPLQ